MIMKNIIIFLILSFFITPTFSATAPSGGGGGWTNKTVTRVALSDVIEATARQQAVRNGTAVTLEAVVQETINRRKIGGVLMKRLLAGGLLVSATQSLLDGIGWILEDGGWVKDKDPDGKECTNFSDCKEIEKLWSVSINSKPQYYSDAKTACKAQMDYFNNPHEIKAVKYLNNGTTAECYHSWGITQTDQFPNPQYDKNSQAPEKEKVKLTEDMLGDLAVGDYTDPVDQSKNKKDKVWTDVENSYKPDVTGNELDQQINNKLDNAPETNNKPSNKPKPDGDGQKYPAPDEKPGGQGETENKPDPETGTQTGTFTLPDWCLWAADQCQWHKEEKEVWKEEKKQRDDQKSFWTKVTDFFDWTKDDKDDGDQEEQEPDTSVLDKKFDTTFSAGGSCPPNPQIEFPVVGVVELPFSKICTFFSYLKFGVLTGASLLACWIVSSAVRGGQT